MKEPSIVKVGLLYKVNGEVVLVIPYAKMFVNILHGKKLHSMIIKLNIRPTI